MTLSLGLERHLGVGRMVLDSIIRKVYKLGNINATKFEGVFEC
jgi:hypothetical protein